MELDQNQYQNFEKWFGNLDVDAVANRPALDCFARYTESVNRPVGLTQFLELMREHRYEVVAGEEENIFARCE